MKIESAIFKRGIKGDNKILDGVVPQVAFIGRSNVGKSSLINALTKVKGLAISSKTPGRTQGINVFHINNTHYFLDLPGYGYTKTKVDIHVKLGKLIFWYLFDSKHKQKVVLIVDAEIGPTADDMEMLHELERVGKEIVIVLNKIDKIKSSQYRNQMAKLSKELVGHKLFPFSSKAKIGIEELTDELLAKR